MRNAILAALIFVLLYNLFFFPTYFGIGFGIFIILGTIYLFSLPRKNNNNLTLAATTAMLASLFALSLGFRGNDVVLLFDLISALFLSSVTAFLLKLENPFSFHLPHFFLSPFIFIKDLVIALFTLGENKDLRELSGKNNAAIVRGLFIAIPLFLVLLFLLTSADPIFNKLTGNFLQSFGQRLIVSVFLFFGLILVALTKIQKITFEEKVTEVSGKAHELAIIAGSIALLFLSFIIVQFEYLFSNIGERNLQQLGIQSLTYSEYVRKGFFELLIAATISSFVILYLLKYLPKLAQKQKRVLQWLGGLLTVETGFLLASDVQRLILYEHTHGLTRARVFGFVFLVWLFAMLAILLVRIIQDFKRSQVFATTLVFTVLALVVINVLNVDDLIATQFRPTVNGETDWFYISSLSSDAYPSWQEAVNDTEQTISQVETERAKINPTVPEASASEIHRSLTEEQSRKIYWAKLTLEQLQNHIRFLQNRYTFGSIKNWQMYNFSEYQAYQFLQKNPSFVQTVNGLADRANTLQSGNLPIIPLDRDSNPPLTH